MREYKWKLLWKQIHTYLSLERYEIDVAVKPEVFMTSTHLFMPFKAEGFYGWLHNPNIWEIDWPQWSPRDFERYTCCSPREIVRIIHNYLSLKGHETNAAVKPEVFMESTHLYMPFEAEVFMDCHQDRLRDIKIKADCFYKLLCTCTYTPQPQKA